MRSEFGGGDESEYLSWDLPGDFTLCYTYVKFQEDEYETTFILYSSIDYMGRVYLLYVAHECDIVEWII